MKIFWKELVVLACIVGASAGETMAQKQKFTWPNGKKMALSLTFDDARASQAIAGAPLLDEYGVKGTFYLVPDNAKNQLEAWKRAVAKGHEMGNHSIHHPCSGNFVWSRENALEKYTLDKMQAELNETNSRIKQMLGVTPESYAYPCGHTVIGRGRGAQSFVPLISDMFVTGRSWLDEAPVDPAYCDMAQLTGVEMDGKEFEQLLPMIEAAGKGNQWLVLAGHETGDSGNQTTRLATLRKLCEYAKNPANGVWIAPVSEIAAYVKAARDTINIPDMVVQSANGDLLLTANSGKGVGPKIQYMPEWKAFGWFTSADYVEWEVEVAKAGTYTVDLDWSVADEEAGKPFVVDFGKSQLKGIVKKSGSWETFKTTRVGVIKLAAGRQKVSFKPATKFEKGALLDLRSLKLSSAK